MPDRTEAKPLYVVAGVADLAAAALRELPAQMPGITERAAAARSRLADRLAGLPADVDKLRAELPADLQTFREELPGVLHDAQVRAQRAAREIADTYAELATRGEGAVERFRRDHADTLDALTSRVAKTAERAADAADRFADGVAERRAARNGT